MIPDELGRSTSNKDALPICYAISEYLIALKAFTFYVTHYLDLATTLSQLYSNVKTQHFSVSVN